MKEHELKCWTEFYMDVESGIKPFEVREETDRKFEVGDILHLNEFNKLSELYTGRNCKKKVTYTLRGLPFVPDNHVIMGLSDYEVDSSKVFKNIPNREDCLDAMAYANEIRNRVEVVKPRLRPKIMFSQSLPYEYQFHDENLAIKLDEDNAIAVEWNDLDNFIKDLREVKRIVNE